MRRTIMMLFLFVMSIGIFAQESELEKKQREYRFATTEEKALMDSLYQPIADKLLKEKNIKITIYEKKFRYINSNDFHNGIIKL